MIHQPPNELLAKSRTGARPPLTLAQHVEDAENAAGAIFRDGSRWLAAFLRFFRLEGVHDAKRFRTHLRLAALAHDIGKANSDFQQALQSPGYRQTIRHEHLSTLFLHHPEVAKWFRVHALDHDAVSAAVLSHHLKAEGEPAFCQPRVGPDVGLRFDDAQVQRTVRRMADVLGVAAPTVAPLPPRFSDSLWSAALQSAKIAARRFGREEGERRQLALALKAGLIAADGVASALVREGYSIEEWIEETAHAPPLRPDDVRNDLLSPRIAQIEARTAQVFVPHRFQDGAAALPRRSLLLAGCGAGKTLAAWRWAERQLVTNPAGRVVFLYPTRGTATEGFRDYVGWAPEGKAELLTGTARYELVSMLDNPPESLRDKELIDDSQHGLFAFALWSKRYFSATVNQFLSFLEHRYESLCLVPAFADSLVILDEIHSYDGKMFASLVDFLEHFDVPVLAMTATLPPSRVEQLEARGLRVYPQSAERTELIDLEEAERHPRYRLVKCSGEEDAYGRVSHAFREGRRVLWVTNVVRRCQTLARRLSTSLGVELGTDVLAYHSRFRLVDRRRAHEATVAAFQTSDRPVVAVTTQVCEMSLNLDADVLVSEHAPIPSLVQRFGRANRHLRHGKTFRADLVLYQPVSRAPYEAEELNCVPPFLASLPPEPSQRDLAIALETHARSERHASTGLTSFLTGGYYARRGEFREGDDFGARSVLDRDLEEVVSLTRINKPIDGFVLTVPKKWSRTADISGLPPWLGVASASSYSPQLGFEDPPGGTS